MVGLQLELPRIHWSTYSVSRCTFIQSFNLFSNCRRVLVAWHIEGCRDIDGDNRLFRFRMRDTWKEIYGKEIHGFGFELVLPFAEHFVFFSFSLSFLPLHVHPFFSGSVKHFLLPFIPFLVG